MSLWRDELRPARATNFAVATLGLIAALSLDRAFVTPVYLAWVIPAIGISALAAVALGRRSLGGAALLVALVGVATLPMLFAPQLTSYGFPTTAAFRLVGTLLRSGLGGIAGEAAPVPAEPRFLAVVWIAGLLLGFLGAAWVVVGRPLGAVIASLGVVAFAGSVGEGPGRDVYAFAAVAAVAAFFLLEGRHRLASWGRITTKIPAQLGVPTALAAALLALAAPLLLRAESPLVNLESAFRPRLVIIKPLSDIKRQLKVDPPIEVLRVRADRPTYWRLTGLDEYTGKEWLLEARPRSQHDGDIPLPEPVPGGGTLDQRYRITSLLAPWLPAAYAPDQVDSPVPFEIDEPSSTLLLQGRTVPGLTYTVRSRLPSKPVDGIAAMGQSGDERERFFGEIARPIVGDARSPFQVASRLERHFRTYRYDEDVPAGHTVERLQRFLRDRRGYCEQFAAVMTLMLRGLGADARVGVGFLPGARSEGAYVVSTRDAHAWVEVNLPGLGWTNFDPTPGRGEPASGESPAEQPVATPEPAGQPSEQPVPTPAQEPVPDTAQVPGQERGLPGWLLPVAGVVLVGASPAAAKALRRRHRRTDQGVLGAYAELVDRSRDLGWRSGPSETQREFHRRVFAPVSTQASTAAGRLVELSALALYAGQPTGGAGGAEAWKASSVALAALRKAAPAWRRLLAVFDPRTLVVPYETTGGWTVDEPAPFWKRLVAFAIDDVIVAIPSILIVLLTDTSARNAFVATLPWLLLVPYSWLLLAFNEGRTVGMRLLGIRIARPDGSAIDLRTAGIRALVAALSAAAVFVGYLWALVDAQGRTWHDIVAGTRAFNDRAELASTDEPQVRRPALV
jgi:transglutaminase-like putative cysteine protease/uncharacterized RDD family membrane protein YckC